MIAARQFHLDLPHRPAQGREDFFVSPSNAAAVAWIDRWPEWPTGAAGRALALYGPEGAGKSHLAAVWQARARARILPLPRLDLSDVPQWAATPLALEQDDQTFDEGALFHLLNLMKEQGQGLLLLSRAAPAQWPTVLPDLRSRLSSLPAVGIQKPDDSLIAQILVKLFADRQIRVGLDVVHYILPRMERSFAAAQTLVARLDALSLQNKKPVSVALARQAMET